MKCEECPHTLPCYGGRLRIDLCPVCGATVLKGPMTLTTEHRYKSPTVARVMCLERVLTAEMQMAFLRQVADTCRYDNMWKEEDIPVWAERTLLQIQHEGMHLKDPGPTDRSVYIAVCEECVALRIKVLEAHDTEDLPDPTVFYLKQGTHESACMQALCDLFERIVRI